MRKLTLGCLLIGVTFISTSALAVNPGFYLGANISYNNIDTGAAPVAYKGLGGGISLGYNFQTNEHIILGIESTGNYLGSFSNFDYSLSAGTLVGTGTYIVNKQLDAFLKIGIARENLSDGNDYGSSDIAPTASLGVALNLNPQWDLDLQYTHIFGGSIRGVVYNRSDRAFTFNSVLVGMTYYFGSRQKLDSPVQG